MISVNQNVTDTFNNNHSIQSGISANIDINCNTLINFLDDDITGNAYQTISDRQPFKKLFPLDTVVKSFRPVKSGVKYAISGDVPAFSWTNPRDIDYIPKLPNGSIVTYRTYYPSKDIYYKYFITPLNENASISVRYFDGSSPISDKNKKVPCNKIVFKFELGHATPTSWAVILNGTDISSSLSKTVPATGSIELYYTGSAWSRNKSDLNMNASVMVSTLGLTAVNPGGYIGIIELSPHWVKDLTDNLVTLKILKESAASSEGILPVGNLTANSLEMFLNGYNQESMIFKTYTKHDTSEMDPDFIYISKHAEIEVFVKVYHSSGDFEDSTGKYYAVPQGFFLVDNWAFTEHGEATLFALDYSKILQETICPDIVCDGYSAVAIIRRILDSIGFTNYNFNYTSNDQSIITPDYWWSDSTETVWTVLQEICRDTQMSACVDENNILQFYSRDYMYSSDRSSNWMFSNSEGQDGKLPNIISMEIKELPSINQVKVLYSSAYITTYEQSAKELVSVNNTVLASSSLSSSLPVASNDDKENWTEQQKWISINPITTAQAQLTNFVPVLSEYSGYLLIGSEVIEYDAIEYEYITAIEDTVNGQTYAANSKIKIPITSANDIAKYRGRAKVSSDSSGSVGVVAFNPTGRYRVKSRGAFGTKPSAHSSNINYDKNGWQGFSNITWRNK